MKMSPLGEGREEVIDSGHGGVPHPSSREGDGPRPARLGHADVNITARIYSHMLPDDDARAADAWEAIVELDSAEPEVKTIPGSENTPAKRIQ